MNTYPAYKDSCIEWIGEIPEHWEVKKLKYVTKVNPSSKNFNFEKDSNTEVIFLPMEKVSATGEINQELTKKIETVSSGYTYFERGDIVLAKITPCFENGKGALLNDLVTEFGFGSTEFHIIRATAKSEKNFIFYQTKANRFMQLGEAFMTGSAGQKRVPSSFIEDYVIALPPLPEQTAIANYLDSKTEQLDTLISNKQKLIELLKEERTAIINQAVTKGLNPNAPMKDSGIEWLGEIPAHWEVKKLKFFSTVVLGKMLTNDDKGGYQLKPYLRAKNIEWLKPNISDLKQMWFSQKELLQYRVKKNDILVSEGGEVGRACIWDEETEECYIQNSVHKVTFSNKTDPNYFLYQFRIFGFKGHFDAIVNRISIAHLTKEKISDIQFIYPPVHEQQAIVEHIQTAQAKINTIITKTQQEINLLKEYKTALISEVVTGKVDVREEAYYLNHGLDGLKDYTDYKAAKKSVKFEQSF